MFNPCRTLTVKSAIPRRRLTSWNAGKKACFAESPTSTPRFQNSKPTAVMYQPICNRTPTAVAMALSLPKACCSNLRTVRLDDFAQDDHQRDVNDGENEENIHRPNDTEPQPALAEASFAAEFSSEVVQK